ncbi:hypothetical protein SAMN05720470_11118 [Fibrobacter sp. UWOV1]|uniref:DUF6588 family protein n=1 Tax=Fibrobacter sp. UWOV1 TaxID=1896215 RepID=UPI0009113BBA|nr:DUF6588 family protein [Fibrobacter sp. UWOV1]SHL63269.1 hypothetical protein SAMN05720470_11118 [Fibrobacter sp. UWOV1]
MKKLFLAALIMGAAAATAMDDSGWATQFESMSAFDSQYGNRSGYVKPIIDNLGNVLNSNWYASASVPQSFTFEAGLPISIIPIGDDDKSYDGKPTIFGDHGNPEAPSDTIYGIKTLNGLGVFTYPYLQMGASFYHFRAVLRMMYLPSISDLRKFSLFGIGFQYSFGHFFQYMLPKAAQPFDVSIVYAYNSSTIGYRPDEFDGKLGLDVSTHNFSFVFGYKPVNFFEVMMSLGYQSAEMLSYGELYQIDPYTNFRKNEIYPDITVKGNNGFRFGIAIALQINSFHPVLGYDYAGKSSFTTNVLYFKSQFGKDKTPDEIAKDKGYVRGGNVKTQSSETEAPVEQASTIEETPADEPVEAPEAPAVEENSAEASTEDTFNEE